MLADFEPVVVEVYERTNTPHSHTVVPNEVRLNGRRLLTTEDEPVMIREVVANGQELLYVTISLLARRIVFDSAPKEAKPEE